MTSQITLKGRYYWHLLDDIDNPANVTVTRTVTTKSACKITRSSFHQLSSEIAKTEASHAGASIEVGGAFKAISGSVKSEFDTSSEIKSTLSDLQSSRPKRPLKSLWKSRENVFDGPGMHGQTETFKSGGNPDISEVPVDIALYLESIHFLEDIKVVYTDDVFLKPNDAIHVVNNQSADINKGHGGKFVWLVPQWTKEVSKACTSVEIIISEHKLHHPDLALEAGGKYRYLRVDRNTNTPAKITDIALLRNGDSVRFDHVKKLGYDGRSIDINQGREGDYLYLVWKSLDINGPVIKS